VSARCPNRRVQKRVGPGGGKPQCPGRLQVVLQVGVALPCKAIPRGYDSWERTLPARYRRSGRPSSAGQRCSSRALQRGGSPRVLGALNAGAPAVSLGGHSDRLGRGVIVARGIPGRTS
jgi:hypothetical protein